MIPMLNGIDHIHVYVNSWAKAEQWYKTVLGFTRVNALMVWAEKNGPLTIRNASANIQLALFESNQHSHSTIAFAASGEEFINWKTHLEQHLTELKLADHKLSWSLYFTDPFGNPYEITTGDYKFVADLLG